MRCPYCSSNRLEVFESRHNIRGVRRQRRCKNYDKRFSTEERIVTYKRGRPGRAPVEASDFKMEEVKFLRKEVLKAQKQINKILLFLSEDFDLGPTEFNPFERN